MRNRLRQETVEALIIKKNSPDFSFVQFYILILNGKTLLAEIRSSDINAINDEPDPPMSWPL